MATSDFETVISTRRLFYIPNTREFFANASDFGWPAGQFPPRVDVVSHRTGVRKTFVLVGPSYSGEDTPDRELFSMRYEAHGLALVVLND